MSSFDLTEPTPFYSSGLGSDYSVRVGDGGWSKRHSTEKFYGDFLGSQRPLLFLCTWIMSCSNQKGLDFRCTIFLLSCPTLVHKV